MYRRSNILGKPFILTSRMFKVIVVWIFVLAVDAHCLVGPIVSTSAAYSTVIYATIALSHCLHCMIQYNHNMLCSSRRHSPMFSRPPCAPSNIHQSSSLSPSLSLFFPQITPHQQKPSNLQVTHLTHIIAATNHPHQIQSRLLRPERSTATIPTTICLRSCPFSPSRLLPFSPRQPRAT